MKRHCCKDYKSKVRLEYLCMSLIRWGGAYWNDAMPIAQPSLEGYRSDNATFRAINYCGTMLIMRCQLRDLHWRGATRARHDLQGHHINVCQLQTGLLQFSIAISLTYYLSAQVCNVSFCVLISLTIGGTGLFNNVVFSHWLIVSKFSCQCGSLTRAR